MDNLNTKDTILLVDDAQAVLDVGALMIKRFGYKVLQATNGMEASQVFRANIDDICLVILDVKLPDELGSDKASFSRSFFLYWSGIRSFKYRC
jgi:DNA-binding response OmpR family regulator